MNVLTVVMGCEAVFAEPRVYLVPPFRNHGLIAYDEIMSGVEFLHDRHGFHGFPKSHDVSVDATGVLRNKFNVFLLEWVKLVLYVHTNTFNLFLEN